MRNIDIESLEYFILKIKTVCSCWLLQRGDGVIVGLTDHDHPLIKEGVTYKPLVVISSSVYDTALSDMQNSIEVLGALSSDDLTETDLHKGLWQGAKVTLMQVNWQNPEQAVTLFQGYMGKITLEGEQFRAEIETPLTFMNQLITRTYKKTCDAVFGSSRCGVNLEDDLYYITANIFQDTAQTSITLTGAGEYTDGWFSGGQAFCMTGQNAGLKRMVRDFVRLSTLTNTQEVLLWLPFPFPLQTGDSIKLTVGCDKSWQTCRNKFNNKPNFRGCPHLMGSDWMLSTPVRK